MYNQLYNYHTTYEIGVNMRSYESVILRYCISMQVYAVLQSYLQNMLTIKDGMMN